MKRCVQQLSCCLVLLFIGITVNAQNHLPDSLHVLLDEVVIRNNALHKIISPTPSQILNGKKLSSLNSFSIADAVRYFSGVQLKDYGGVGGLKTINVRSMGTQHVAVLFDGINLGNAQNGTVDLGKFSLDNIEAIELYNGQKNSLQQPARAYLASSSMFIKTRIPQFDSSSHHLLKTSFKTGSFGLINPSILWHQQVNNKWSTAVSTEYIHAHGRYKYRDIKKGQSGGYDTTAIRHNGDIEAFRAESGLFYKHRQSDGFIKGYFYNSERGLPGAIVANNYYNPQRLWDRNAFIQGSYKYVADSNYSILLNAKYAYDYTKYLNPDLIRLDGQLTNHYHQTEVFASVAQQYNINRLWQVGLSTDINYNLLNADLDNFVYPRRYSYIGVLSSNLSWNRLLLQSSLLYCYYDENVKYFQTSEDRKALLPYIGASWQPTANKEFRLRGFYKESLRMPTFNDLYYTDIGNRKLRPEYTRQTNLGFIFHKEVNATERFSIQSDIYYNRIKDKIIATPTGRMFNWMMTNQGLVIIRGIDIAADYNRLLGNTILFQAGFTYTFQKAQDKTKGESYYNHQIAYTPVHSGTLHGSLQWRSWSLNYSYIYTGERYVLPENKPENYMQPWYTTDLGVVWDKKINNKQYKLSLEVNNIFNQYYDVVLNYPMPGTNFRTTLSLTL
jgi:vitamin B12 transporter